MKSFILLSTCIAVSWALDGEIKNNFTNPQIATQGYESSSDDHVEINCASPQVMANASFPNWIKIWRVNGSEEFDVSFLTFVNKNATLMFNQVTERNAGMYECCYHAYAYEDFECSSTELIIDDSLPIATTEASLLEDAWNVNLTSEDYLNCITGNSYFVRLFKINITTLECVLEENSTIALQTLNSFPSPLNNDVSIFKYDPLVHDGTYICNATYDYENNTMNFFSTFTVRESADTNIHSEHLPHNIVDPYLKSVDTSHWSNSLCKMLDSSLHESRTTNLTLVEMQIEVQGPLFMDTMLNLKPRRS
ncbi:unnamed protein product [Auanema sp. JU1783]|nr:unnamed protein product [Auanema sp. JU1783]